MCCPHHDSFFTRVHVYIRSDIDHWEIPCCLSNEVVACVCVGWGVKQHTTLAKKSSQPRNPCGWSTTGQLDHVILCDIELQFGIEATRDICGSRARVGDWSRCRMILHDCTADQSLMNFLAETIFLARVVEFQIVKPTSNPVLLTACCIVLSKTLFLMVFLIIKLSLTFTNPTFFSLSLSHCLLLLFSFFSTSLLSGLLLVFSFSGTAHLSRRSGRRSLRRSFMTTKQTVKWTSTLLKMKTSFRKILMLPSNLVKCWELQWWIKIELSNNLFQALWRSLLFSLSI